MKVAYITRSIIPSRSANSIHVMKISEAFCECCSNFSLIVPETKDSIETEEILDYYGIKTPFHIERVKAKDTQGKWYRYIFALETIKKIWKNKYDSIITRDPLVAFLCVLLHKRTVLDLHGELAHLCGRAYRIIKWDFFRKSKYLKLVMITESLVKYYEKKYGLNPQLCTVLPDGCTVENFEEYCNNELFANAQISIAYAGSFGVGRGYEIIEGLAQNLKAYTYEIYGGTAEDAQKVTGRVPPENIKFNGFVPNRDMPEELCKHDILLLPYQSTLIAKGEDTGKVMSPLKMFEYMASGRVIIASDLEVLKEILQDTNCYFAKADDLNSWISKVEEVVNNRETAKKKALQAKTDVKAYTWKIRAQKMLRLLC